MLLRRATACVAMCCIAVASCASGMSSGSDSSPTSVATGKPFPAERCAANRAVGPITYLTSFDYSASASIVDVLVAEQKGYFDALCLDVDIKPSFAPDNYSQVATKSAQFSSGGSFSEVVDYATQHPGAGLIALAVEGKVAIDVLIVKEGAATSLADLEGATIGVKGALTPSVQAMLAKAGLIDGTDYSTVALDGFDPRVHINAPGIVGFPGYKCNEPGQLDRAGIAYTLFDPAADDIPGSFGVIYTTRDFMTDHPLATQDFVRASMQGLADAIADPAAASMIAIDFIDNAGNPTALDPDGETFRWQIESKLITDSTPTGEPVGVADRKQLEAEVRTYAGIGLFGGRPPDISALYDTKVLTSIYDSQNEVIWPDQ